MTKRRLFVLVVVVLMATLMAGCNQLGIGQTGTDDSVAPVFTEDQELKVVNACKAGVDEVTIDGIPAACWRYNWPPGAVAACVHEPGGSAAVEGKVMPCSLVPKWQVETFVSFGELATDEEAAEPEPTATPTAEPAAEPEAEEETEPDVDDESEDELELEEEEIEIESDESEDESNDVSEAEDEEDGSNYEYPVGFTPDEALVMNVDAVLPAIPNDIRIYQCFPQDYSEAIATEASSYCRGHNDMFPWGAPRAGWDYHYNDASRDNSRRANFQIPTFNWMSFTGEELWLPGIGSVRDPDGGAAMIVLLNPWEVPGEFEMGYVLHGFWATGQVFDMSDLTTNWDEESEVYVDNEYGSYSMETLATLRNHFVYQLGFGRFDGQCSRAENCRTVTWVAVIRWYDGSFHLIDEGQWRK